MKQYYREVIIGLLLTCCLGFGLRAQNHAGKNYVAQLHITNQQLQLELKQRDLRDNQTLRMFMRSNLSNDNIRYLKSIGWPIEVKNEKTTPVSTVPDTSK